MAKPFYFYDAGVFPLLLLFLLICQFSNGTIQSVDGGSNNKLMEADSKPGEKHAAAGQTVPISDSKRPPSISAEGSGANPDDEDGDVDDEDGEGSGDSAEGSGAPPPASEEGVRPKEQLGHGREEGGVVQPIEERRPVQPPTTRTTPAAETPSIPFLPDSQTTRKTWTTSSTTTTTPRTPPPFFVPPLTTTTASSPPRTTTKPMLRPKPPGPPPPFAIDPTGTLEQLKPGIFAIMIGAAVVLILLLILIITYIFYRIRKKDEGSYTCEEPSQPHHYSYAYQKASIKEFYA